MIRIMTADEPALTTITVDGQLAGDNIQAVETICDQARSNGKPIWLFLRDVAVIGEDGQALLRRLATKGVRLKASGIYTSYIVRSIQPDPLPRTDVEVRAMSMRRGDNSVEVSLRDIRKTAPQGQAGFDTCLDTCLDS